MTDWFLVKFIDDVCTMSARKRTVCFILLRKNLLNFPFLNQSRFFRYSFTFFHGAWVEWNVIWAHNLWYIWPRPQFLRIWRSHLMKLIMNHFIFHRSSELVHTIVIVNGFLFNSREIVYQSVYFIIDLEIKSLD